MHLVLVLTRGMSLAAWEKNGSLLRELALYQRMVERGARISLISWGGKAERDIAQRFPWLKVYGNFYNLPTKRYERLMPLLHALPFIKADIVKSNQTNGADCALRCARFWGKPFISRCGYVWSESCRKENSELLEQALCIERDVFSGADACIVTTLEAGKYLAATHDLLLEAFTCVPNYIPDAFLHAPLPDYFAGQKPMIIQVGRLAPEKNLFALIEACAGLDATLKLIGQGPEREALAEHARIHEVRMEFIRSVEHPQLPSVLCESTICALVSHYEGHPKALLEYMACGCAVLGSDVQGISTVIEDRKTGLLCGTDPASIRVGLETLLRNAALRETLGQNARKAAAQFSLDAVLDRELSVYEKFPRRTRGQKGVSALGALLAYAGRKAPRVFPWKVATSDDDFCVDIVNRISRRIAKKSPEETLRIFSALERQMAFLSQKTNDVFLADAMATVQTFIAEKSPEEALRILFSFEERLYTLEGKLAIAYDGGVHTKHRHIKYHDFFVNRVQKGERVLDVGCGIGFLAYDMADKAHASVTGIELSGENITVARSRFAHPNVTYTRGNALTDIEGGEYDTVVLSNVLEHFPERIAFLTALRKKLRPKRFLLRVPLFERDWRVPLKKELGMEWRLDPTHETEYTYERFVYELTRAGLAIRYKEFRWGEIWCEATDSIEFMHASPPSCPVTVLMACHNDKNYVEEAISSILRQTMRDFSFLIIDDASTDGTAAIIGEYARKDARICLLTNESNLGLTASLNRGIQAIETSYIARIDADDIAFPERLEYQLAYMESHPEIAAAGCHLLFFDDELQEDKPRSWTPPVAPDDIRRHSFTIGPALSHPGSMLRTSAVKAVGGYRTQFASTQDYDLWLRLLEAYDLGNIPCTLILYRQHGRAVSQAKATEQAINHVLALQSSEHRRQGKCDPLEGAAATLALLVSLLDPQQPSFYAWISLLAQRPVRGRAELLFEALRLLMPYGAVFSSGKDDAYPTKLADYEWEAVVWILAQAEELRSVSDFSVVMQFAKAMKDESGRSE